MNASALIEDDMLRRNAFPHYPNCALIFIIVGGLAEPARSSTDSHLA